MSLPRQKHREIVFQLLFSIDFTSIEEKDMIVMLEKQLKVSKKNLFNALEQAQQVSNMKDQLDQKIADASESYSIKQIHRIEMIIMRLSLYEMHHTDVPPKVAVDEALRLARKFSTEQSVRFVNGILNTLMKEVSDATLSVAE